MSEATALTAGFMLFWLELSTGRRLLPTLGGSALVWSTCLAFFQTALLAGYALARLTTALPRRAQGLLHLALAVVAAITLNFTPPPFDGSPLPWLLTTLFRSTGFPLVVLASTTPLLTRWHNTRAAGVFAASNVGSFMALLGYPILIEPRCGLAAQTTFWMAGFALYTVLLAIAGPWSQPDQVEEITGTEPPPIRDWLLLSAVPSALLTALTTHLTQEVPAGPYLWALLLLVYLASFVLAFSPTAVSWIELVLVVEPLLLAVAVVLLFPPMRLGGFWLHLVTFFIVSLSLHGRLALMAPEGDRGIYLLCIAAGGAAGGLFSALAAPQLFAWVAEYPLALLAAAALRPSPSDLDEGLPATRATRTDLAVPAVLGVTLAVLFRALPHRGDEWDGLARMAILLQAAAVAFLARHRPWRFTLCLLAILIPSALLLRPGDTLLAVRSPYGVCRVVSHQRDLLLMHGTTIHGGRDHTGRPLAYHAPESPLGRLLMTHARPGTRVGVVGLGAGALAWYGSRGLVIRFYELDPLIVQVAADPQYFRFLPPHPDVVLGDGRLSLARVKPSSFDVIVLDAFGSDAVPVHLLTREALRVYARALAPLGLLIFNVTNRHVDLTPVLATLASDAGVGARVARTPNLGTWVAVASVPAQGRWLAADARWQPLPAASGPLWTDDHSALLPLLTW